MKAVEFQGVQRLSPFWRIKNALMSQNKAPRKRTEINAVRQSFCLAALIVEVECGLVSTFIPPSAQGFDPVVSAFSVGGKWLEQIEASWVVAEFAKGGMLLLAGRAA